MGKWWQRPKLRRDEEQGRERRVGFLELFYDLIIVVAVAQVGHDLAGHPDWWHAGRFALLFAALWWLWIGNTFYVDRFEMEDVSQRAITLLQMIPLVGLAVFAHDAFGAMRLPFATSYAVGRLLIILLWVRGGRSDPAARPVTDGYVTGFTLGLLPWLLSLAAPSAWVPFLWAASLLVDLSVPVFIRGRQRLLPRFSHSRLSERFGLFTIIVLGESVAATVNGLGMRTDIGAYDQLVGLLAMVLAFQLWWIYFDMVPRERIRPGMAAALARSFLHLPLLGAITASGAGVLGFVAAPGGNVDAGHRLLLGASVALSLLCMVALSRAHLYLPQFASARLRTEGSLAGAAVMVLALATFGAGLGAATLLALVIALVAIPIAWSVWRWAQSEAVAGA